MTRVHCSEMKCCSVVSVCVEVCALMEVNVFSEVSELQIFVFVLKCYRYVHVDVL